MRYLPLTNDDRENMKKVIGISDINEMFTNLPKEVLLDPKFNLPNHKTEMEVGKILSEIQDQAEILDTDYGDEFIKLKIRGREKSIRRLFK